MQPADQIECIRDFLPTEITQTSATQQLVFKPVKMWACSQKAPQEN